jgi:polyhydroxyalkanoate synthesis regulator phasin
MRTELFEPIGMHSAIPKFDAAGTFVGSSYVYATARDFARFGLLYLRGGVWDSGRVLPEGWVDHARTPTTSELPPGETRRYGAHWWLWDDGLGTFAAHGYEGQRVALVPELDLIVVRLGKTTADHYEDLHDLLTEIVDCFRGVSGRVGVSVASLLGEEGAMTDDESISEFTPLSRERAEQIVRRLVAEGRLAQERAEDRVEELIATSRARGEQFSAAVQREVAEQVAALRAQIAELEAKVSEALRQTRASLRRASASSAAAARTVAKKARSKVPAKRRKKKAPAKRAPAKKAPAKKRTPAKRTTSTKKKAPAKRTASTRSTTKKATKKKAPAKRG